MTDAYIFDAVRSPRGKGKKDGSLHEVTSLKLSADVLNALRDRNDLPTEQVEDVIWGCVTPVGEQGANIARSAVLYAGWHERAPGLHINRFCASGMEAVNLAANHCWRIPGTRSNTTTSRPRRSIAASRRRARRGASRATRRARCNA